MENKLSRVKINSDKPINNIVQPKLEPIVTPIQNITDEIK